MFVSNSLSRLALLEAKAQFWIQSRGCFDVSMPSWFKANKNVPSQRNMERFVMSESANVSDFIHHLVPRAFTWTVAPLARQRTCKPGRTRFPLRSTFLPRLLLHESRPSLLPSWGGKTRVQTAANAEFRRSLLAGHWLYRAKSKTTGGEEKNKNKIKWSAASPP